MSTFTSEQLLARAREKVKSLEFAVTQTAFADSRAELEEELELARIALASLEAEPVAYVDPFAFHNFSVYRAGETDNKRMGREWMWANPDAGLIPVYTAPPALVSVMDEAQSRELFEKNCMANIERNKWHPDLYAHLPAREQWAAWEACRAAMLQGAEPVSNRDELPDGWVAVPVEPTEDMIVNGFESEPDESFSDEKEWEAYDAMSGCQQAAHRAKLCWAAMISAAPKV